MQRNECCVSWSSRGCSSYVKRREVGLGRTTRQADGSSGRSTTLSLRPPRSERARDQHITVVYRTDSSDIPIVRKIGRKIPDESRGAPRRRACRFGRTRRGRGSPRRPARRRCRAGPSARRCSPTSRCRRTGCGRLPPRRPRPISATQARIAAHICLGIVGRRRAAGADRPDRLVGDDQLARPARRSRPPSAARTWPSTLSSVSPASRSSSVSPTHTIGVIPWRWMAADLLGHHLVGLAEQLAPFAVADDDVARRRAWRGTPATTSPVNAPLSSQWQCWAPRANRSLSASITVCTLRMSVNGGWMLTSTSLEVVLADEVGQLLHASGSPRSG